MTPYKLWEKAVGKAFALETLLICLIGTIGLLAEQIGNLFK